MGFEFWPSSQKARSFEPLQWLTVLYVKLPVRTDEMFLFVSILNDVSDKKTHLNELVNACINSFKMQSFNKKKNN
jgi:hypothetical protein